MESKNRWYVYILRCSDNTLYTGVTTDLARRLQQHNHGNRGARYTRHRRPVHLVYHEPVSDRSAAQRREHAIRRLSLSAKRRLVDTGAGDCPPETTVPLKTGAT